MSLGSALSRFLIVFSLSVCPCLLILPHRRTKSESDKIRIMARRPHSPGEVLTKNDLAELQRRLSMMTVTAVEDFYQYTHSACRIFPGHFPSARAIQALVQVWKQMRKWR
jgi:hypothetical protein